MNIAEKVKEIYDNLIEDGKVGKANNWAVANPIYLPIRKLTNDETGDIGELLCNDIFKNSGYRVEYEQAITENEKDWDIVINDIKIEIKTATIGKTQKTFQHENIEENKQYDVLMIFDFTATDLYCCIAWKADIKFSELSRLPQKNKLNISLYQYEKNNILKFKKSKFKKLKTEEDLKNLFEEFIKDQN